MALSDSEQPLISVVIPNFNNEKYLSECIDSVLNQTYQNIEVVCIDDASTDNSLIILSRYLETHPNFVLIQNNKNLGISKNRHKAILACNGEYFTTLDSDDFFISNRKVELELTKIKEYERASNVNVVAFSDIRLVDGAGLELFPNAVNNVKEGNIFTDVLLRQCMIPRDYLVSKQLYLQAGGFDPKIPLYEDWDLKIRLAYRNHFVYSGVKGIGYRRHGAGLSSVDKQQHIDWLSYIFLKNIDLVGVDRLEAFKLDFAKMLENSFGVDNLIVKLSEPYLKRIIRKVRTIF